MAEWPLKGPECGADRRSLALVQGTYWRIGGNAAVSALTADGLLNLGFADVAFWSQTRENVLRYSVDVENCAAAEAALQVRNALYAFVEGEAVRYIGKTTRSIRKRFIGYCNPGSAQPTNKRCHENIVSVLNNRGIVRIYVFVPISQLRYGDFEIDLASALEESLITAFSPPWNGREGVRAVSEDAEREAIAEPQAALREGSGIEPGTADCPGPRPMQRSGPENLLTFAIKLGQTYYQQGFINPGVEASKHIGKHGEPIIVYLGGRSDSVNSFINRTANLNGSARLVGNNRRIAEWFQRNFRPGDIVKGAVLDANHILLRTQRHAAEQ